MWPGKGVHYSKNRPNGITNVSGVWVCVCVFVSFLRHGLCQPVSLNWGGLIPLNSILPLSTSRLKSRPEVASILKGITGYDVSFPMLFTFYLCLSLSHSLTHSLTHCLSFVLPLNILDCQNWGWGGGKGGERETVWRGWRKGAKEGG